MGLDFAVKYRAGRRETSTPENARSEVRPVGAVRTSRGHAQLAEPPTASSKLACALEGPASRVPLATAAGRRLMFEILTDPEGNEFCLLEPS
jgi:hypothetical protein